MPTVQDTLIQRTNTQAEKWTRLVSDVQGMLDQPIQRWFHFGHLPSYRALAREQKWAANPAATQTLVRDLTAFSEMHPVWQFFYWLFNVGFIHDKTGSMWAEHFYKMPLHA